MNKKIRENKLVKQEKNISEPHQNLSDELVHFSFRHLDIKHKKFLIDSRNSRYFEKMLERLKSICSLHKREILCNRSNALRAHPIDWKDTTETSGFRHLNDQLQQLLPYQFEICSNEHGRVHGFFIDNIFFIVWFDPDHKLYQ